jgi:hypothetical protein
MIVCSVAAPVVVYTTAQQWLFALGYLQEMPAQGVKKTVAVYSAAAEVLHSTA